MKFIAQRLLDIGVTMAIDLHGFIAFGLVFGPNFPNGIRERLEFIGSLPEIESADLGPACACVSNEFLSYQLAAHNSII